MKKNISTILFLLGVILLIFISSHEHKEKSAVITVYVHGTLFNFRNMFSYIPTASYLTYAPDGLTAVKDLEENAVARKLAQDFKKIDKKRFVYDNFYAFGWSGKLSFSERKKSAQNLVQELMKVVEEYKLEHNIIPKVRIVTFSHGGNVALNTAHYLPEDIKAELILIACPIQDETESLIESDTFSKIYTISSLNDVLQVSDPQNIYRNINNKDAKRVLSGRFFDKDVSKVKQACISVNGRYLGHLEMFQLFNRHIPTVLDRLDGLVEITGKTISYINIEDKSFPFLNGYNILDVIKGNRYELDEEHV